MKLIIVGWYNLIYPIITAKENFEILGYDVYFLPLLYFCQKYNGDDLYNSLHQFIKNIDPSIILWWNWECPSDILIKIKENTCGILHCLFNWDHPYCLSHWDYNFNRKIASKNIWDICFVTSKSEHEKYINSGSQEVYYLRMFADDEVHYPEKDDNYVCDISLVCTSLYDNKEFYPNTLVSRREIITNLIKENLDVKIYGPVELKKDFPNNYVDFVHFLDNHKVFYNSKINLCTHVANGYKYFNERVGTILSSGGLLFVDNVEGNDEILQDNVNCVKINDNYVEQVKSILENYDKYDTVKKNGIITAKNKFCPIFWTKFIDSKIKNYLKNKNINYLNTLNNLNYHEKKVSIIMTYYNRINQVINTFKTIQESNYPKEFIEVICYDDKSDKEPLIIDTSKYDFKIKLIYGNYEHDNKIINPTHAFNNAFKYITGEYVIIQNSECMHIGDLISYVAENLKENNLFSFPCWATGNEDITDNIFKNRHDKNILNLIIENDYIKLKDYPNDLKGWYNHKLIRPECLHFCNALHINTFKKIGLFNTKINEILGFDDNDYAQRIMFNENIDIIIPDLDKWLFVVHQNHEKYNISRPYELFLKSRNLYFKINNQRINNFINNTNLQSEKIININYLEIEKDIFFTKLKELWSIYFVNIIIKDNSDKLDYKFLRQCLKESNIKLLYI